MTQTENTAIVLRHVNYRDNDRMVTLFSPSRGRVLKKAHKSALFEQADKPGSVVE